MTFIDIHTHKDNPAFGHYALMNISSEFDLLPATGLFSAGLHPWHLHPDAVSMEWQKLQSFCSKPNVLAIGECGLDKVCTTNEGLQQEYFIKQIELANSLNKPLIIHCVRAFDEVLLLLKRIPVRVPVVFHGYNKSKELADRILADGHYLSFGIHIIEKPPVQEVFRKTPFDKVLLETDAAEVSIESIYLKAAEVKGIPLEVLAAQLEKNAIRVFGEKIIINHE